jgi:hypothetical protein
VSTGHERGHFFMARLYEFRLAFRPVEGTDETVDTVARISKNASDSPFVKPTQHIVGHVLTMSGTRLALSDRWCSRHANVS